MRAIKTAFYVQGFITENCWIARLNLRSQRPPWKQVTARWGKQLPMAQRAAITDESTPST
uniref:Uncharacterized protein n=1 Tax=Arundo donax TaxID=35708 RepID=A0A0A8Y772_ARUDO